MTRVAALTMVLTLAGTPAAATACLLWCGSTHCQPAPLQTNRAVTTGQNACDEVVASAPVLREDSRREGTAPSTTNVFLDSRHHGFGADLESRSVACVLSESDPSPGHQKYPTVLRL